jgi:hypothetical protein
MKQIAAIVLAIASSMQLVGQATNPQNTFGGAVNANKPSLWMNFNDATASYGDAISGLSFGYAGAIAPSYTTFCNNTPTASTTTTTCSLNSSVVAGSTLIVFYGFATPTSITDSGGATFVPAVVSTGSGVYVGYFQNVAAGTHTITMTFSSAQAYPILMVSSASNAPTSGLPIDTSIYNVVGTSSSTFSSGALTTSANNELLVGIQVGSTNTQTVGSPAFTFLSSGGWTGIFQAWYAAGVAGSYAFTGNQTNASGYTAVVVAVKGAPQAGAASTPRQPGFDNTNNANFSASFPYNGWNVAPNTTLQSAMEWNTPWTMLLHINSFAYDGTGTVVLASRGDSNSASINNVWWKLFVQPASGNAYGNQLCFYRSAPAPYTVLESGSYFVVRQEVCTPTTGIALLPGFNHDIVVESAGTGSADITMWINGTAQSLIYPVNSTQGYGGLVLTIASGGTGYTSAPTLGVSGGGATCNIGSSTVTVSGGAIATISNNATYGCTSAPTITITGGGGSGGSITATAPAMKMNSPNYPLMVPGYVFAGAYNGQDGGDSSQSPLVVDEFAVFPSALSFGQIMNIFYGTKFYQGLLYPGLTANPPQVILNNYGCGPDFSGDATTAMTIRSHQLGLIHLLAIDDQDSQAYDQASQPWYRQMLDQAGLNDIPVTTANTGSVGANLGGCPSANLTAYNANTPHQPTNAIYLNSTTLFRTLFAKYSTTPIYVFMTQTANSYNLFQLSAADGISSLTGLQLQQQNYNNGGWVNAFEGNFATTPTYYLSLLNNTGSNPIYFEGGSPAQNGPSVIVSRVATDPFWLTAYNMGTAGSGEVVYGYTNQNLAQLISPYFQGGVEITASGGTGYANMTAFTATGGGPFCHVSGYMVSSGGVPASFVTPWNAFVATSYAGIGYGCHPVSFTATGVGTTLTVAAFQCCNIGPYNLDPPKLSVGDTIIGTGVPAGTVITSIGSTGGGIGVYTTNNITTATTASALTRQPTIVLTAPTGTGVTLSATIGIHPNTYEGSGTAQYSAWPNMYSIATVGGAVFTWFQNSLMAPPTTGQPAQ